MVTIHNVLVMMMIDNENRKLWSVNEQATKDPLILIETSIFQKYVLNCTII